MRKWKKMGCHGMAAVFFLIMALETSSAALAAGKAPYQDVKVAKYEVYSENEKFEGRSVYRYDRQGNSIEDLVYNRDGELTSRKTYAYNDAGLLTNTSGYDNKGMKIQEEVKSYNGSGKVTSHEFYKKGELSWKALYVYDERGMLVEKSRYESSKGIESPVWVQKYSYDADGNLTVKSRFYGDTESHREEFAYNERNQVVSYKEYNGNGEPLEKKETDYRKDANVAEVRYYTYSPEEELRVRETYFYDEEGKLAKEIVSYPDSKDTFYKMIFDKEGNMTRSIYTYKGQMQWCTIMKYNERGQKTSQYTINAKGEREKRQSFQYDSYGNIVSYTEEGQASQTFWYAYNSQGQIRTEKRYSDGNLIGSYRYAYYD